MLLSFALYKLRYREIPEIDPENQGMPSIGVEEQK